MVLKGLLNLKYDNDDYIVAGNGKYTNVSEVLNLMLMEKVFVSVKKMFSKKELFRASGKLIKESTPSKLYLYHVGGQNLDSVLWDNVGKKLEIEIKNISK